MLARARARSLLTTPVKLLDDRLTRSRISAQGRQLHRVPRDTEGSPQHRCASRPAPTTRLRSGRINTYRACIASAPRLRFARPTGTAILWPTIATPCSTGMLLGQRVFKNWRRNKPSLPRRINTRFYGSSWSRLRQYQGSSRTTCSAIITDIGGAPRAGSSWRVGTSIPARRRCSSRSMASRRLRYKFRNPIGAILSTRDLEYLGALARRGRSKPRSHGGRSRSAGPPPTSAARSAPAQSALSFRNDKVNPVSFYVSVLKMKVEAGSLMTLTSLFSAARRR